MIVTPFSERLNFASDAQDVPLSLLEAAVLASRTISEPAEAQEAFAKLAPALQQYRPHPQFAVACGMLIEKQRHVEGMLEFWSDLRTVFPADQTALRMLMRWYRRNRDVEAAIALVEVQLPARETDPDQAEAAVVALAELHAAEQLDALMAVIRQAFPEDRTIRLLYIKSLRDQSRFIEAANVAVEIADHGKLGPAAQALIGDVQQRARQLARLSTCRARDAIPRIVDRLPVLLRGPTEDFGQITFFTGQLGSGGAERQMTRIATAFHKLHQDGKAVAGHSLLAPVGVAVRHATPASGSDFFLADLQGAGIDVSALTDLPAVDVSDLDNVAPGVSRLLALLPDDMREHTCKMVTYFQQHRTAVAYLWQDGGVLSAGLAALLAGVPRIVVSFRGLPPNVRPNLFRPELEPLYRTLMSQPHVTFTSNSATAARAYESWLGMASGQIVVVPNASPPILPDGTPEDEAVLADIQARSPGCTQTVLGIFRFDENKRPQFWIETAARYARANPHVRFVLIGTGYQLTACSALIKSLGMENQIFLAGLQKRVGFFLHRADVLMHLARMEGLPNVIIEAQLAGLPVVATPAGGTDEVMTDGRTGYILASATDPDPEEIVTRLGMLLRDDAQRAAFGGAAKTQAETRFLVDHIVERTARIFADHTDRRP